MSYFGRSDPSIIGVYHCTGWRWIQLENQSLKGFRYDYKCFYRSTIYLIPKITFLQLLGLRNKG
jgi:hypothetical protein